MDEYRKLQILICVFYMLLGFSTILLTEKLYRNENDLEI